MANVSQVKAKTFAANGADTTAICANQTNSGSGSMTLTDTGAAGVLVPGNLGTTVTIISTASDSNTGITFDVTGMGVDGSEVSQTGITGPAGTSTVYDQILGTNIRRPFLHVRYRASQTEDRRMKSWLTGSAGGAYTSNLDAMEVNFLSERCLVTQAANNFVLFQGI